MKYMHITLDVGAAIKAYHVVWNDPHRWKNVLIHLGDFHSFKAFFGAIKRFVSGRGFEEIIYQAGLFTSVSMKGLLSGKHCNLCWWIHETFSDALERLFTSHFLSEDEETISSMQALNDPSDIKNCIANDQRIADVIQRYQELMLKGLNGDFGNTTQF